MSVHQDAHRASQVVRVEGKFFVLDSNGKHDKMSVNCIKVARNTEEDLGEKLEQYHFFLQLHKYSVAALSGHLDVYVSQKMYACHWRGERGRFIVEVPFLTFSSHTNVVMLTTNYHIIKN